MSEGAGSREDAPKIQAALSAIEVELSSFVIGNRIPGRFSDAARRASEENYHGKQTVSGSHFDIVIDLSGFGLSKRAKQKVAETVERNIAHPRDNDADSYYQLRLHINQPSVAYVGNMEFFWSVSAKDHIVIRLH